MLKKSNTKIYRYDCEVDVRNPYYAGFYVIIEEETKGDEVIWSAMLRHEGIGFTEEMFGVPKSDYCKTLKEFVDMVEGNLINQDYFKWFIEDCDDDELFCMYKEEFKEWLGKSCGCPVCGKEA